MNRKLLLLLGSLVVILFSSCDDELGGLGTIDDLQVEKEMLIPYLPVTDTTVVQSVSLVDAIENGLGSDQTLGQVEKVQIDAVHIDFLSANNQENFDFLEYANMGVQTSALEYLNIASIDSVVPGSTALDLTTGELYIDDYAMSDTLELVWGAKSYEPVDSLKVKTKITFSVKLKILSDD